MLKKVKKTLIVFGILAFVIFIFRGWLFRKSVSYTKTGLRKSIELTDKNLITQLKLEKDKLSLEEIIAIAQKKTNKRLSFTRGRSSKDPNRVIGKGKANCIGYSALFNAISNYLIIKQNYGDKYKANHLIGTVDFMGINLHQFSDDPFFKEHDYNEIINLNTGEKIYFDPVVSDYLKINQITSK